MQDRPKGDGRKPNFAEAAQSSARVAESVQNSRCCRCRAVSKDQGSRVFRLSKGHFFGIARKDQAMSFLVRHQQ